MPRAGGLDRAIETAFRASQELRDDPDRSARASLEEPTNVWVTGPTLEGASLQAQQGAVAGEHGPVASELRRRLANALGGASIGTGRWDAPLPISTAPIG